YLDRQYHLRCQLLQNLRANHGRHSGLIHPGIEFDNVSANDWRIQRLNYLNHLPRGEAAWLAMRDTRRERRIERVHVNRNINRRFETQFEAILEISHLDYFHPEAFGLLTLMTVHRANADLYQTLRQRFLQNARKWAGMRIRITVKIVIEIGMRVEVQNTDR